jgi:hypothetical protein
MVQSADGWWWEHRAHVYRYIFIVGEVSCSGLLPDIVASKSCVCKAARLSVLHTSTEKVIGGR